jgi:hypothetical protein
MATPDSQATGGPLTVDQSLNLLMAAQEELRQRDAELSALKSQQAETKRDIIQAELQQGDNFTKRARPMVVYAGLVFIFVNYVVLPPIFALAGKPLGPSGVFDLPSNFWTAWGGIVATWSIGRSFEKVGVSNRMVRMITGSSAPVAPPVPNAPTDGAVG